jgi:hypothetical protein
MDHRTSLAVLFLGWTCLFLFGCQGNPPPPGRNADSDAQASVREGLIEISGSNGTLKKEGSEAVSLQVDPVKVASGTHIELSNRKSKCLSRFPTGGTIEFIGKARVTLRGDGFFTNTGKFVAAFTGSQKTFYQVFTPVAVLGVKGTKISFNLDEGKGRITLLEGEITVADPAKAGETTTLTPGESIILGESAFMKEPASEVPLTGGSGQTGQSNLPDTSIGGDIPEVYDENDLGTASQRVLDSMDTP